MKRKRDSGLGRDGTEDECINLVTKDSVHVHVVHESTVGSFRGRPIMLPAVPFADESTLHSIPPPVDFAEIAILR